MLDEKGFDLWADGYDSLVGLSDERNTYPFAGYKEVLGDVFDTVMRRKGSVLDLGFGTATLTSKLYGGGCRVFGQDFSSRMIQLAAEKMPEAKLYRGDFSLGLAEPLLAEKYDSIVATYSFHHLTDDRKVSLIRELLRLLKEGGRILIGDVAFETREEREACRLQAGEEWDDEEYYFVVSEMKEEFPDLVFRKKSFCAGVMELGLTGGKT